ncbi:hypothetical protein [Nonomuraea jiangxiensis]|uniref:Uncharacterized protein n=1 Tax=Nonomuraea jiangxiensis TaxID=633440 RepID=A0A1G9P9E3_9ACTN|nr:hypothetical protein [Nonomuraea jiangxiensis]SDL95492.1 hypothetical protein SAMN05421869_13378 [Nonomuraea jiangxiensis]
MSARVLTTASTLTCPHPPGAVRPPAAHPLTVAGASVLTKADVVGRDVLPACALPVAQGPPQTKTCTKVTSWNGGEAVRLTVNGAGVLLDQGFVAKTDGLDVGVPPDPPQPSLPPKLSATANQTWLRGE